MSIFAFIRPYQLLTFKKKVTFRQLFSRPGPCDPYTGRLMYLQHQLNCALVLNPLITLGINNYSQCLYN